MKNLQAASRADFSDAKITFNVDVNSVNTSVEQRDSHLKSPDFFEAEKYPEMKFESTSFYKVAATKDNAEGELYELKGNLTIKDVTKPVTFNVVYNGKFTDPKGITKAGFKAKTTINRMDYHINYDSDGKGVAKDISINLYLEMIQNQP